MDDIVRLRAYGELTIGEENMVLAEALFRELDAHGLVYQNKGRLKHGEDHVTISFNGKFAKNVTLHILFFEQSQSMQIQTVDMIEIPEAKLQEMLVLANELNQEFRFAKFYIDFPNQTAEMEMDTLLYPDVDSGSLCYQSVIRAMQICDKAYQKMMYTIYAEQYLAKQ